MLNVKQRTVLFYVLMAGVAAFTPVGRAATNGVDLPRWLVQPLSLADALRIALEQNGSILQSQYDLQAAHGVALQTRAIILPKVRGSAGYEHNEAVEKETFITSGVVPVVTDRLSRPKDEWAGSIRVVQSIYEGGRMAASWRVARLVQAQAYNEYQATIANVLLDVRTAYYDVLLARQQIVVQEAAVKLRGVQLDRTRERMQAGLIPNFNVLRAEVALASTQPQLIRAQNNYRIAKNQLATLLGYNLPTSVWEDVPLNLTTTLEVVPYEVLLPQALVQALERRPELRALRNEVGLRQERVKMAKSGYKPSLAVYGGYTAHNSEFRDDFYNDVSGPVAGVTLSWDIFDGLGTRGRVVEARAAAAKASVNLDEVVRRVEQEVRTAYSRFLEAQQVIESQKRVVERASEALRLAESRFEAGTSPQIEVLDAHTSLVEAQTTEIDARRDYSVARARLERAIGLDVSQETAGTTVIERIREP